MSSLPRRMQRMSSRSERAKKAAISRQFATQLGVTSPKAKDLLARQSRHSVKIIAKPRALRRSTRSQKWLEARVAKRAQA